MQDIERRPSQSIRDIVVVAGLLWLLNWLFARRDFGWIAFNPSPWLLLPVLIGTRYGIARGVIAGLLAGLVVAAMQGRAAGQTMALFAGQHLYYLTALALSGFLAGEMNRQRKAKSRDLTQDHQLLVEKTALLSAELELARETRQDLQRHLALLNAPLAAFDDDLRKLITGPREQLHSGLLATLHHLAGISSAAFYQQDAGGNLRRLAVLHPTALLAERLNIDQVPLAAQAIEAGTIARVTDPMETSQVQPFLVALPWSTQTASGVLLVQDMPLEAFQPSGLARLELILEWAFALTRHREGLQSSGECGAPLAKEVFIELLGRALEAEKQHHLPSTIVKVDFLDTKEATSAQVERTLLKALPPTGVSTRLSGNGSLLVLLPFGGEAESRGLGQSLTATGFQLRQTVYLVAGPASLNDFWAHVMLP